MNKEFFKEYLLKPLCYAVVIVIVLFLLNQFTYFNFSLSSNQNYNSFEVIGTGKVTVTPNIAQTTFSVSEKGTTQEASKNAANTKQNQAVEELKKLGVKEADIKTTGFYVNPNYEDVLDTMSIRPPSTKQNGYVTNITTSVKSQNVETINKAIDALTKIGLNVSGVEYTFDDREKYVLEAQNKAIAQAKSQAADWARAAGFKLGKIVSVRNADENGGYQPYAADAAMNLKSEAPATQTDLQPGENEITARMGVSFYIK